jgi:uncharacterized protein (DUF1501 family)
LEPALLARRLVEAGSRFVTVVDTGWDTHQQIFKELPDSRFRAAAAAQPDRAYAALITDLRERGLLDSTLVVLMGEFGRTPKLNAAPGSRPLAEGPDQFASQAAA